MTHLPDSLEDAVDPHVHNCPSRPCQGATILCIREEWLKHAWDNVSDVSGRGADKSQSFQGAQSRAEFPWAIRSRVRRDFATGIRRASNRYASQNVGWANFRVADYTGGEYQSDGRSVFEPDAEMRSKVDNRRLSAQAASSN